MKPIKTLLRSLALALLACAVPARAEIVNVAGDGTPYADRPLYANASIYALIDQNRTAVFHSETDDTPGLAYAVDLGKNFTITSLKVYPRQDGCCPERFRNVRISIHNDNAGAPGAEVWGQTLYGDGTNPGSGPGIVVEVVLPTPQSGRWVRLEALDNPPGDYALQMTELEVYADVPASEVNRAEGKVATANQAIFAGQNAQSLVDGSRSAVVHGVETPQPGYAYTINLGSSVRLSRIVLWPRQDACCPDRLTNFRVSVLSDNAGQPGDVVWKADRYTDGSFPLTEPGSRDTLLADLDPTGSFRGQWIRIESLEDPVSPYALQLAEVQAFGEAEGGVNVLLTQSPQAASTGVGRTVTFTAAATAVNGDPTLLGYQWLKNGEVIPGATEATYTTPPILVADDKAQFAVRVSYPGFATINSDAAVLRVNLAFQAETAFNRPLWPNGGWSTGLLVDGNRSVAIHGDAEIEVGAEYTVNMGAGIKFEQIDIYPRQDGCCPDRLRNIRVSVHPDNAGSPGPANWQVDLFTDGTDAGSGAGVVVRLLAAMDTNPQSKFEGQWVKILNLEEPVTAYAMQVAEIEAYGSFASGIPILGVFVEPGDVGTVAGRVATFSVEARLINGDPARIGYQWYKNDALIPDATERTYTTPPLAGADDGALYHVVLSYPGVANVSSRKAKAVFDGNYAKNQPAFSNRPLWAPGGWNIGMIVDGSKAVAVHADTAPSAGMAYEVNLGTIVQVERIDIYPRQDGCCPDRLTNIRVSLHSDNNGAAGDETWHADLFTDGTDAGSGEGVVVTINAAMGTGTFQGHWVRILSLADPISDYAMQMAEVEVYGVGSLVAPTVSVARTPEGSVRITYAGGVLESANALTGQWSPVQGASSPWVVVPNGDLLLFRVRP